MRLAITLLFAFFLLSVNAQRSWFMNGLKNIAARLPEEEKKQEEQASWWPEAAEESNLDWETELR